MSDTPAKSPEILFQENSGQLSMSQALKFGINRYTLYSMRDRGVIELVSRGVYRLKDLPSLSNLDLAIVGSRCSGAVICLISALSFHNMTTQVPHVVSIAIKKNGGIPVLDFPPLKAYRMIDRFYNEGIDEYDIDGIKLKVYDPEKTLVDCFRFRNQIGLDTAIEALRMYKETRKMNFNKIMQYAKICKMVKIMQPYLEVLV